MLPHTAQYPCRNRLGPSTLIEVTHGLGCSLLRVEQGTSSFAQFCSEIRTPNL
jgi:hypothetical protein